MANKINFQVDFNVNKANLTDLNSMLQSIQKMTTKEFLSINKGLDINTARTELQSLKSTIGDIQSALSKAYNTNLGNINVSKFNKELQSSNISLKQAHQTLRQFGSVGESAFRTLTTDLLTTNVQLKESHKLLDSMAQTMANTVRFGLASSVFNRVTNEIQRAYDYSIKLDTSLNDIRIVSDKSADDMERFAVQANKAAKALGSSTLDYTKASTIYYQQGLGDEDTAARAETTLKTANVTGQTGEEVSEQLTAIWNGYKVSAQEAELYIDKVAAVAAATAADLKELSTGMSKTASAANAMGVDFDNLNAMIATVVSVTREAPETIGTSFRSIFSRMTQLEADGTDEFGVTLSQVTSKMEAMGIQILDQNGQLKDMDDILADVAGKWDTWSKGQQVAAARAMAGTQQYSRFIALMDNQDMWDDALETSKTSLGELDKENEKYLESTAAHLKQLSTTWEDVQKSLIDQEGLNSIIDTMTSLVDIFGNFVDATGQGAKSLTAFGAIAMQVLNKQMAQGIATTIGNMQNNKYNQNVLQNSKNNVKEAYKEKQDSPILENTLKNIENLQQYYKLLDESQINASLNLINQEQKAAELEQQWKETTEAAVQYAEKISGVTNLTKEDLGDTDFDTLREPMLEMEEQIKATKNVYQSFQDIIKNNEFAEDMYDDLQDLIKALEKFQDALQIDDKKFKQILNDLDTIDVDTLQKAFFDSTPDNALAKNIEKTMTSMSSAVKEQSDEAKKELDTINEVIKKDVETNYSETQRLYDEHKKVNDKLEEDQNKLKNLGIGETISQIATSTTQLASAMMTLTNIPSIFNDEDLTSGEKFLQIIMALGTSIPMLLGGISNLTDGWTGMVSLLPELKTKIIEMAIAHKAQGASSAEAAVGETGLAVAEGIQGKAAEGATAPTMTLTAAIGSLLLELLPFILIGAAVGTAIWGLVKAFNADADAAKEAAAAQERATEAANQAKQEYEELQATFDKYDKGVEAFEKLEEGAEGYDEALKEANQTAMELISKNSELAKYAYKDSTTGLIKFRDEAKDVVENAKNRASTTEMTKNIATIQSNEALTKSQNTNLMRQLGIDSWTSTSTDEYGNFQFVDDAQMEKIIQTIIDSGGITQQDLENIGIDNTDLQNKILDNTDKLTTLASSTEALNLTNRLLLDETLKENLKNKDANFAKMSNAEQEAVTSIYGDFIASDEQQNKIRKAAEEKYKDKWFDGADEEMVHQEYAKAMGWTYTKDKWFGKAEFLDKDGKKVTMSDADVRKYLAQQEVANNLDADEAKRQRIQTSVGSIYDFTKGAVSEDAAGQLLGFLSGKDKKFEAKDFSADQLKGLQGLIGTKEFEDVLNKIDWSDFTYDSKEAFLEAINQGMNEYDWKAGYDTQAKNAQQQAEKLQDVSSLLSSKDYTDLDEDELKMVNELETKYSELASIKEKGSHEYLQLLRQIKEQEEKNAKEALVNAGKAQEEKIDKLTSELDAMEKTTNKDGELVFVDEEKAKEKIKEIEDALDELAKNRYQIQLQIDTDLASDVEDAFGMADELGKLQDYVHDDLTYTFEEAQEIIAKGYGEMFTNAKETADNTIQVNKDVLNSFIDDKQAEIEADKQAKISQLEQQKILLNAQKQALISKLSALQEAAAAETETDAVTAMQKVQNAELEYQNQTKQLQALLNNEADGANETQTINQELYNALGGMYEQNSENEQQAEKDSTDNQAQNINRRIENVKLLNNAYRGLANQIAVTEAGTDNGELKVGTASGGIGVSTTGSKDVQTTNITAGQIDLKQLGLVDEQGKTNQQYRDTINALIKNTQSQINKIDSQIGAADAGIAALKSAGSSLDKAQKNARPGGSKGSGSSKDPDSKEYIEDEKDLYHDVNIELEQISTNLSRLEKQQSKLTGQKLIDNLNKQLQQLNKQIDKTNEKIGIARFEAAGLRSELASKGATFNADGTLANYAQIYDAQLAYVNSIIAQYNSMSAEAQEGYKDVVEQAQKDFEALVDNIEKYDELISSTIPDLEDEIQDAIDKQIEINIEKFNMEIEIRLDLAEAERDWNEFKKKVIDGIKEDDILGNTKARLQDFYSYYKQDGTGVVQRNTVHVEDILEQLRQIDTTGTSSVYGDNKAQALEDLKTYYKQLMQDLEDIVDLQEKVHEAYLDMMDEAQEKFDEQIDTYKQISTLIEHDMKLIQLTRGENSYDELSKYYEKQQENYQQQIAFQKQQVDFWKQQMDVAEQGSEEWKKAKENWIAAIDDWRSTVNDAIEQLQDKYLNMIDSIFDKLNNKVTDGLGLDYVNEEWELINKNADQYLDTINAMYGIQKLENKYLDAIDNTDSISAQRKLNDLMDQELESLREKDKLTQYDIDRANMKYEIALKQIALEEAQQNKSQMRLKRDSQGNYSYQFVSDQDETGKLQDELADLNNQLYNFDKDHLKENLNEAYSLYEEFTDKLKELYSDPTIDPEQREQRRLLLTEQYGDLINGIIDQNEQIRYNLYESGFTELADLYNVDYSNFEQLSNDEKDILMNDMLPMWDSGVQHMIDKFAGEGGFEGTCKDALTNLAEATRDYQNDLTELEQAADMSFDSIANGEDRVIDQTRELLNDNEELIDSYQRQLDAVRQVINELETLIGKYNSAEAAAKSATEAAYKYWQEQQRQAAEAAAKEAAKMTGNNSSSNSGNNSSAGNGAGSGGGNSGSVATGQEVQVKASATTFTRDAGNGIRFMRGVAGNKFYVAQVSGNEVLIKDPHGPNYTAKGYTGWVRKTDLEGFRTGGYTGDWPGDEGRLALIHKKELMLNADDTPNMLKAVSVLRNITANIGSNMLAQMAGVKAPSATAAAATDTIEQNVHIDASFPNATSSKEIEDAFHNLVHIASQRTFRNKK